MWARANGRAWLGHYQSARQRPHRVKRRSRGSDPHTPARVQVGAPKASTACLWREGISPIFAMVPAGTRPPSVCKVGHGLTGDGRMVAHACANRRDATPFHRTRDGARLHYRLQGARFPVAPSSCYAVGRPRRTRSWPRFASTRPSGASSRSTCAAWSSWPWIRRSGPPASWRSSARPPRASQRASVPAGPDRGTEGDD